jgi:hypothetical protein
MTPARVAFLVVGTPRSGTTLVQRLACELPGVAVPFETHFFTKGLPVLEAEGGFPLEGDALARGLAAYAALPHLEGTGLDPDAVAARVGGRAESPLALFDAVVAQLAGPAAVLGEKTPGHLHWAGRLAAARPDLRIVAVVRDPRAVAASHRAVPWGADPVEVTAARWVDDQRALADLQAALGPRLLLLRYEDVVEDPSAARTRLAELLGVDATGGGNEAPAAPVHLPWETWKAGASEEVTTERQDAWTDVLTAVEGDRVMARCAPEAARYGYAGAPTGVRRLRALATSTRRNRRRARAVAPRRAKLRARVANADLGA